MNGILKAYLDNVEFGEMKVFGGMGVLPVFRKGYDALDHLTLKEALDQGTLVIGEVSHAGSVPELKATNRGSCPSWSWTAKNSSGRSRIGFSTPPYSSWAVRRSLFRYHVPSMGAGYTNPSTSGIPGS